MGETINLYPCVLGAYRAGQRAGYDLPMDEALRKRVDSDQVLAQYATKQPPDIPYHRKIHWPIEPSDERISSILSAAFRLGVILAVWHGVARSTRTPSSEYFENRRAWDRYGDYLVERIVNQLLARVGAILENTAQRQREILVRKLPWYCRNSYLAHDPGAFEGSRSEVFREAKYLLKGEMSSRVDSIVRRPNVAMIEFGEALIREICASIAPGLDPEVFLETIVHAPTDVVEMLVAAYFREFIANSPLRDRQSLWRPLAKAVDQRVFVVHGRNLDIRNQIVNLLKRSDYEPIVLQRELNRGATLIEKLEATSNCFYAVIILSPDDYGGLSFGLKDPPQLRIGESRARQNVIFELGWFMALLGRDRICCVLSEDLAVPSDINGLVYYRINEVNQVLNEIRKIEA